MGKIPIGGGEITLMFYSQVTKGNFIPSLPDPCLRVSQFPCSQWLRFIFPVEFLVVEWSEK